MEKPLILMVFGPKEATFYMKDSHPSNQAG
jgi:hypothetical protein